MKSAAKVPVPKQPPERQASARKWYLLYFLLAAFDVFTVSISVMFNHEIQAIYTTAVEVNQAWNQRLNSYRELQFQAAAVNAPGNDVFDSRDVKVEREKLRKALREFDRGVDVIWKDLDAAKGQATVAPLFRDLEAIKAAMVEMAVQAESLFASFEGQGPEAAGKQLALMNRTYARVLQTFNDLTADVGHLQKQLLVEQKGAAIELRSYENIIGACIILMIGGATFYGYRLARQMNADGRKMDHYIEDLRKADAELRKAHDELELRVEQRTAQLADTNKALEAEVSERRRAEIALRESEHRFRTMADSAPVMIWLTGQDRRIHYFNKVWIHFTGRTPSDSENVWAACVHPEDLQHCEAIQTEAFAAQRPFEREYRLCRFDGDFRWVYEQATPRLQSDGSFLGYIGSCVDITERKKAEQVLRDSERLFHTLAQVSPVGIVRADARGKCVYVNERWCEIAGLTEQEAMGEGWLQAIHPEDREQVFTEWYQAMAEGRQFKLEYRMLSPDSVLTWVYGQSEVERGPAGEVQGYVNTITNINEHKKTENELRRVQERAQLIDRVTIDVVWDWDLATNQIWWSEGLYRVFGYNPADVQPAATWWIARIHGDDRPVVMKQLHGLFDSGGHAWADEFRFSRSNGTFTRVSARGQIVRDRRGQAARLVGAMSDLGAAQA